ncbi:MAG: hypothetical protein R3Y63_13485 [Eubacteriales bacterium]
MTTKRTVSLLCSVILMGSLIPQPSLANEATVDQDTALSYSQESRMTYINRASAGLTIRGNRATVSSRVFGYANLATKCSVKVTLQEKTLFSWKNVDTKTKTEHDSVLLYDLDYPVSSGKTYRVVSEVTVWSGSKSETRTVTSTSQKA